MSKTSKATKRATSPRFGCGLGLMSGTSCDGVEAAVVRFEESKGRLSARLHSHATAPYSSKKREILLKGMWTAQQVCVLNWELGLVFAEVARQAIAVAARHGIHVDFIASHGHTLVHLPRTERTSCSGTLQIGEPACIAEATQLPVVSDFRKRDMTVGGQGAPLVPYADWLFFARPDRRVWRLNIGGIANVTSVSRRFDDVIAFDLGPANMLIDAAVRIATKSEMNMDTNGAMAAQGRIDAKLLDILTNHPYLDREPPKSTGIEDFGAGVYLEPALKKRKQTLAPEDLVATATEAAARIIHTSGMRYAWDLGGPADAPAEIIVSGGGARNPTLMGRLRALFGDTPVTTIDDHGIPSEAWEAAAFAILGYETLKGRPSNVPSATGASRAVILGNLTFP